MLTSRSDLEEAADFGLNILLDKRHKDGPNSYYKRNHEVLDDNKGVI